MNSEAQDGPEPPEAVGETAGEAGDAISRIEQALDRIDQRAHRPQPDGLAGAPPLAEIADRLDALIAHLRTALAERPGED